jgi:hypothetical protein
LNRCQHNHHLYVVEHMRRKASGQMEPDGKEVVCGVCRDVWEYRDRDQLPAWLQQEMKNRGL